MSKSLCETFRSLALKTFILLGEGRRVGHQLLEETLTDLNLLELKSQHPYNIQTFTFNKIDEGENGADWEWWLADHTRTKWVGFRVQAKVLNLKTNRFEHLHYKSKSSGEYQLQKLKSECPSWMVPLYCFYIHSTDFDLGYEPSLRSGDFNELIGCSISSLVYIEVLQKLNLKDLNSVMTHSYPWHKLVCKGEESSADLPTAAKEFLERSFGNEYVEILKSQLDLDSIQYSLPEFKSDDIYPIPNIELLDHPPFYVRAILEGIPPQGDFPEGLEGILVITEQSSD